MKRKILHDLASIAGARQRELTARHLLLHPELVATASAADRAALREYIDRKGWRSLYGHDRRMYRLLRAGVEPCLALLPSTAGERMIKSAKQALAFAKVSHLCRVFLEDRE